MVALKKSYFRLWVFACSAWVAIVFLYSQVFDPFKNYGEQMSDEQVWRLLFVMALPISGGGLKFIYDKFVK